VLVSFFTLIPFTAFNQATHADQSALPKRAEDKQEEGALTVINEKGKATAFSAPALAKLPRHSLKVTDPSGTPVTYDGVTLAEVLRAAGVTLGKDLKGPLLANCLVVQASDGYRVVFSLPEIDPDSTDHVVLLANRKDGKPLDAREGPYRLVVPHDKRHARWVRQVTRFAVQAIPEIGTDKKGTAEKPTDNPQH
jgi:hypothetical protein